MNTNLLIRIFIGFALPLILLAHLAGCTSQAGEESSSKVLQSQTSRNTNPDTSPEEMEELVNGNSKFAFDLYHAIQDHPGNLFYSPFSISMALAMTYAGARGETEAQMAQTLDFILPRDRLSTAFNALDLKLASLNEVPANDEEKQPFQLSLANSLWGQRDFTFLTEFLDLLAQNFGAGLRLVDFSGNPEATRQDINDWVEQQTKEKIKNLIPEGGIDNFTRLVLANAIYFKADWAFPFEKSNTQDMPFHLLSGEQVNVPMMSFSGSKNLLYLSGEDFQAVELLYVGDTTAMVILLPNSGKFEDFEARLDASSLESILSQMHDSQVRLTMSKFRYEFELGLKDKLIGMGMPDAFDPNRADFSGIDGERQLFIGNVFHKALVAVDEKGTEAAAATAVVMQAMMAPSQEVILSVDRPFIFLIRDKSTGTLLFIGRVLIPSK